MDFKLSKKDVRETYGSIYYNRGLQYYRDGHVIRLEWAPSELSITAVVTGSGRHVYDVDINFHLTDFDQHISSSCSCPMLYDCKHVVAVLLYFIDKIQNAKHDQKQQPGASTFRRWQQLADNLLHQQGEYYHLNSSSNLLLYILEKSTTNHTVVVCNPVRSRLLKKGGFGKSTPYNLRNIIDYYAPPQWIAEVDSDIATLLLQNQNHVSYTSTPLMIKNDFGYLAMQKMIATGRCFYADSNNKPLTIGDMRNATMEWCDVDDDMRQLTIVVTDDPDKACLILPTEPPSYIDQHTNEYGVLDLPLTANELTLLQQLPPLPQDQLHECSMFLGQTFAQRPIPLPVEVDIRQAATAPFPILLLSAAQRYNGQKCHIARVRFCYEPCVGVPIQVQQHRTDTAMVEIDGIHWQVTPNAEAEQHYLNRMLEMGFTAASEAGVTDDGELNLLFTGKEVVQSAAKWKIFLEQIPQLEEQGWIINFDDSFSMQFTSADTVDFQLEDSDNGWFNMGLDIEHNGQKIAMLPLLIQWLEHGDSNMPLLAALDDGSWLHCPAEMITPVISALVELFDGDSLNDEGQLKLHRSQAHQISHLEQQLDEQVDNVHWHGSKQLRQLAHKLDNFTGIQDVAAPGGLTATLRDYQIKGLAWLQFLREYQFNGILADDMGLGKTIQTLAHLLLEKEAGRLSAPALIVAPTSVLSNWLREAHRFTPDLKVLILHGSARSEHFEKLDKYDIIVTSYALLNRDQEIHLPRVYSAIILDEAQMIKNPQAKVSQVACAINAGHRLCLTGTPVENHLGELWSLFRYLMPGFLGSQKRFNQLFRKPIEKQNNLERRQELQRRLLPFILRRDKQQVASELPAKTTIICNIELGTAQTKLYETVRSAMSKKVRSLLAQKGLQNSHIEILDALLKLRQVCCDPRLLKINTNVTESAKLERLMAMLETQLEEGRKILLFSQFTSMLSLIEAELKSRAIAYSKLTGRTRKRDEAISRFQDGDVPLFLISLKAGGVGLNLTAADTVIHYDPWWNPAVENQATDRAHRIGQDKPVFVYKMIASGTVEEKIVALQEKKQHLADGVYSGGGNNEATKLTGNDLLALIDPAQSGA